MSPMGLQDNSALSVGTFSLVNVSGLSNKGKVSVDKLIGTLHKSIFLEKLLYKYGFSLYNQPVFAFGPSLEQTGISQS